MPFRIGNNEVNVLAIGSNPVRGAAIGDTIFYTLQTPDNPGLITLSNIGGGRTRTASLTVTDADGFTTMPVGTVTVRNGADTNDIQAAAAISFSGTGNARSAALPGRRSAQRYRVLITYNDSNGAHRLQIVTTSGAFSTSVQYETRT